MKVDVEMIELGMDQNGLPCICRKFKNGNAVKIKSVRPEEVAIMTAGLYALNKQVHPEAEAMVLPYREGSVLAVKEIKKS